MAYSIFRILVLVLMFLALAFAETVTGNGFEGYGSNAAATCAHLTSLLPGQVSLPASALYINETATYWSLQESELKPTCRFTPATVKDISTVLSILTSANVPFAIRSGGHMQWAGAANIDNGITIDLGALTNIEVTDTAAGKVVAIGSGLRWGEVYAKLDPLGLTVTGGRENGPGVGGVLTGGGISFFAAAEGFSCDGVVSYKVVLGNGTIVTATAEKNKDLFLALKGGNNNFGIVTKFTLKAIEYSSVRGGGVTYIGAAAEPELLDAFYDFGEAAGRGEDVRTSVIHSHCTITNSNSSAPLIISNDELVNTANIASPPILANFISIAKKYQPYDTTASNRSMLAVVTELGTSSPNGRRESWIAATFKNNLEMMAAVLKTHNTIVAGKLGSVAGIQFCSALQPLHKGILEASAKAGGNSLGLSPEQGNLVLASFNIVWNNATDDDSANEVMEDWIDAMESSSKALGIDHPFVYLNYAMPSQDPIASYGTAIHSALRATSLKYDSKHVFQRLVPGGFKLWR